MELKDKLILIERREISGERAGNRFSYQYYWALSKILDIFEKENDFVLVMEFQDDVIILDNSVNPQFIDFFQIKTNTKKNVNHISSTNLTRREKENGKVTDSYMEKLIDNYVRYRDETRSIHFVSNKTFNLELNSKQDSFGKTSIKLNDLTDDEFNTIKANICNRCGLIGCKSPCKKLIYFDVSDLDVNNYRETVFGKLVFFLKKFGEGSNLSSESVYNTLIAEIARVDNNEKKSENFDELLTRKCITKEKFKEYFHQFKTSGLMFKEWHEISNELRSESFTTMEIKRIKKQWDQYRIISIRV